MDISTDTLVERVDKLIHVHEVAPEWGSPRLSVTPVSMAIQALAAETAALEDAVREIAAEVQKLADRDTSHPD